MELSYTLLSDGSSDRTLIPILNWLLSTYLENYAIQAQWADLSRVNKSLRSTLEERIRLSLELHPCDILFIHRDAEKSSYDARVNEICEVLDELGSSIDVPTVCVVPVRMTEAWLLFDIAALQVKEVIERQGWGDRE
jgi:hypothetical protein